MILRVDMTTQCTYMEEIPSDYAGLGGRGLTSIMINNEVPVHCKLLDADNKLIIGNGPDAVGKHFGNARVPTVKGQSIAGYDPIWIRPWHLFNNMRIKSKHGDIAVLRPMKKTMPKLVKFTI